MRQGLSAAAVLELWEQASSLRPAERALLALSLADSSEPDATVGRRDALLLELYSHTFGPVLSAIGSCPSCGEVVDIDVPVSQLVTDPVTAGSGYLDTAAGRVDFRLPRAADLVEAIDADDLLHRCVGTEVTEEQRDEIERLMADSDPGAELELSLSCPTCAYGWSDVLDPAAFVWAATQARARELVDEVDLLARAYGWSEVEILALSGRRRRLYVDKVAG